MFDCNHSWPEQHTQQGAMTQSLPLGKQSWGLPQGGDSYAESWKWEGTSLRNVFNIGLAKKSFQFFHKLLLKTPNETFGQPNI